MHTNNMPQRSRRITSTAPVSSWMVTAMGPPPSLPLGLPLSSLSPNAVSTVSRSVPLLCIAYREAATVPWVRSVATGIGGLEA